MSFCGQCGFQLAPDDTRCSRCGAVVEPETTISHTSGSEYAPSDEATVEAASYRAGRPSQAGSQVTNEPLISPGQQKLVLGPTPYGHDVEGANEATSMMSAPVYQGSPPATGSSYPNYPPQYAPQQTGYQGYANSGGPYAQQYAPAAVKKRRSARTVGLVFILVGILLILGALVVFALQHNGVIGAPGTVQAGDATSSAVVTTPGGQAEAAIQRYYTSVSSHDYTIAYHLWKNNTQKFADFQNGYRYTQSATVAFGNAQTRANNTIYLPVTVSATEIIASTQKTRQNTYTGYYLLEKQADGAWLILSGDLKAA